MSSIGIDAPARLANTQTNPRVNDTLARILTGLAIFGLWAFVARALAPGYVAKPTTVLLAIPRVIVDPAFLTATGITLAAVAEGLAVSSVLGPLIGILIGRSVVADRILRLYIN